MPHALAIYSYSVADRHHIEVQFFGDRPKKPVLTADTFRMRVENDSNYEPEIGIIGADTTIAGLKIAAEVANIDTSTVRCVHLKHTPIWKDENIEIEDQNDSPVYVLHSSGESENKEFDRWIAIAKIRKIEGARDNPRRFAILFYDSEKPFDRENFLQAWAPSVKGFVTKGNKQVFDALEGRKLQEYKQKREEAALEREQHKKRSRFFGALGLLLVAPHFLGFVSALSLIIGCVWAALDPAFLLPVTSSAAAPVLMAMLGISVFTILVGSLICGVALLIGDYNVRKNHVFPSRKNYDLLNYFADWPTRIRNWHKDRPLQATFLYLGLIGSVAMAAAILLLGIDMPLLNFVAEVVKSGFQALGFASIAPDDGFFALHVFTAVITTLTPLALGAFAMRFVTFLEDGVLPPRDKEIVEAKSSEDLSTLTVRFYDGLSAELSVQADLKPSINVSKIGYTKDQLFFLDETDQKQQTKSAAELHDALKYSPGKYRVDVV